MKSVLVNKKNEQLIVCVLENGKISEKYIFSNTTDNLLGNIYACKVDKIVEGMQAAFVDIGKEKKAFISVKDALPKVDVVTEKQSQNGKMSFVLNEGQPLLAQVKKEPTDEKGARISTHITLPGKYIVLMPETNIITISQKIEDDTEKQRLKELVKSNLEENYGAIVRTEAENIGEESIKEDIKTLFELWQDIKNQYEKDNSVRLIYSGYEVIDFITRELVNKDTNKLYINDKTIFEKIRDDLTTIDTEFYDEDLLEKFGLVTEYSKIEDRKVWLKCGGQIVIDKTEALTAIDINSSKFTGKEDLEATIFKVNSEAAVEIMRQLRLKDIGGIIVIDFIDMKNEEHKEKILEILKKEAKKDRSRVSIHEFTKLNLVEMTRKKVHSTTNN
ncbi:MAG: Rne/Rng family ribonuclease [Clostridia bacterium]|nr:Rne/Rng family ribonuclease [Clostridia bacterium]